MHQAEFNLIKAQQEVHAHPSSLHLINIECKMTDILKKAKEERESALRQKAKINWLTMGDENTKFFHQSLMHRQRTNTINVLHIGDEITSDQSRIQLTFLEYYKDLLCNDIKERRLINMNIIHHGPVLSKDQQRLLSLSFSGEDIRKAM